MSLTTQTIDTELAMNYMKNIPVDSWAVGSPQKPTRTGGTEIQFWLDGENRESGIQASFKVYYQALTNNIHEVSLELKIEEPRSITRFQGKEAEELYRGIASHVSNEENSNWNEFSANRT
jgi:hypothetical protein